MATATFLRDAAGNERCCSPCLTREAEWSRQGWSVARLLTLAACALLVLADGRFGWANGIAVRLTIKSSQVRHSFHLAFSPDSKTLAFTDENGGVTLWDVVGDKERMRLNEPGKRKTNWALRCLAFSPDGGALALGCYAGGIRLWDVAAGKVSDVVARGVVAPISVAFAADGRTLAVADQQRVILWDLVRREERARIAGMGRNSIAIPFAPDLKLVALNSPKFEIGLWRPDTGRRCAVLMSEKSPTHNSTMCFAPDGQLLASGGDNWVNVWDVGKCKLMAVLKNDRVWQVAFSPDGRMLAVVDHSGWIRLWDVTARRERATFCGHEELSHQDDILAFSPEGQLLAVRCPDESIKLWDLARVKRKPPDAAETARLWATLEGDDASVAYQAIRTLTAFPTHTLPLLRKQLQTRFVTAEEARKMDALLAQLDSDDFVTREKASKELEQIGSRAEATLHRALTGQPPLETRRRLQALLESIERQRKGIEPIQQLRALEVLEHIGTVEARALLEEVAKGIPEARLMQDAQASLARLKKRPVAKP